MENNPKNNNDEEEVNTGSPNSGNGNGDGDSILVSTRMQSTNKVSQLETSNKPSSESTLMEAGAKDELERLFDLLKQGKIREYSLIHNKNFLKMAYYRIKSKPGNMTSGADLETLDGISSSWIDKTSESLKNQSFQFKPVRREFIPKANGKKRPLGIPSPRDKIIQEAMRAILEVIYEPVFLNSSHGFRPKRGCHTALKEISR